MNISNKNNSTIEAGTDSISHTSIDSCKDRVSNVNNMIKNENMSTADDKDIIHDIDYLPPLLNNKDNKSAVENVCANCGKEGADINNICNKCKQVKYCSAACKKKHRHKHKKECGEYIRLAAESHDEKLFNQPPSQYGDCSICFLRIPSLQTGYRYYECCGKIVCSGCSFAPVYDHQGNYIAKKTCPYCRAPTRASEDEILKRVKKRSEMNDPIAIFDLGWCHREGLRGLPQDYKKALEYWHRASELGYTNAYANIGNAYHNGEGVERDVKKAYHYYELAAIGGFVKARHNLGMEEEKAGNMDRALKHYMIAARSGESDSLKNIKGLYSRGYVTKIDYNAALQSYQTYLSEIKSGQRDEAAARLDFFRYY